MNISSSELGERTGTYLAKCVKEPIVIERSGEPFAALLSYEDYESLRFAKEVFDDNCWGAAAAEAEAEEAYLSAEESLKFIEDTLNGKD
jgi:prevent-host-death family protein